MKTWQNESPTDRNIRVIIAIIAAIAALNLRGPIAVFLWIVCAIAAVSGLSGFALPYKLLGISTLKKTPRK